jgi:hypothetical protein
VVRDDEASDDARDDEKNDVFLPSKRVEPRAEVEEVEDGLWVEVCVDLVFDAAKESTFRCCRSRFLFCGLCECGLLKECVNLPSSTSKTATVGPAPFLVVEEIESCLLVGREELARVMVSHCELLDGSGTSFA